VKACPPLPELLAPRPARLRAWVARAIIVKGKAWLGCCMRFTLARWPFAKPAACSARVSSCRDPADGRAKHCLRIRHALRGVVQHACGRVGVIGARARVHKLSANPHPQRPRARRGGRPIDGYSAGRVCYDQARLKLAKRWLPSACSHCWCGLLVR
jgi:hypothetical protein